jgi:hypothetical protein
MELEQQLLSVGFVFALLGAALFALRRRFTWPVRGIKDRRLQSTGRVPLTPQHALHLVHYAGKELLIATHPQGCSVITCEGDMGGKPSACAGLSASLVTSEGRPARPPQAEGLPPRISGVGTM